jgi:DNA-binding IclR family transcriptional regulator
MNQPRPPQGAQAALRAVRLLKLFSNERPEMSLAELSRASGLNKTTTHRLLRALQSEALIDRNPATSTYSLGTGLMALGVQALASNDLRKRVRPVLRTLARDTGETATLEVPFEDSMLIIDEVPGSHVLVSAGNIGTRWPIHATSTGKAWLAFDDAGIDRLGQKLKPLTSNTVVQKEDFKPQFAEIRRRGYAVTIDELEVGFTAVATIIRGVLGEVQGALSIGGPTQRLNATRRAELGISLCRAAQRLNPEF